MNFNSIYDILPSYVDNTKFRYLKLDDTYISSLIVTNYPKYSNFLEIVSAFPKDIKYDMGIYITKQDSMKVLKELTYSISLSGSEIKSINKNQIDIDLLDRNKQDALNLRKEIQINGEEVFFVNIIITLFENDKSLLIRNIHNIRSKFYSKGIICNVANFRQLDSYLSTLPYKVCNNNLLELTYRNFTTSALSNQFPFISTNLFDKNGVLFGFFKDGNKICNIDIFDKKYLNSNMCIFGGSGAGKSFFTKLMIIRNYLASRVQFIFDIEGEYENIACNLGVPYIKFGDFNCKYYFNIFQIYSFEILQYGENVISYKINKLAMFFIDVLKDLTESEKDEIKVALEKTYKDFGLLNKENLYRKSSNDNVFLEDTIIPNDKFPTISHFIFNLKLDKLKKVIKEEILIKNPCISNITNFEVDKFFNMVVVFGLKGLQNDKINMFASYILDIVTLYVDGNIKKKNGVNTIIYFDEVWRFIKDEKNKILSFKMFELFKTIRKKNASIILITQDISDFFLYDNGSFGKSILNNSSFKVFFKLEFEDTECLERLFIINKNSLEQISSLEKGQATLFVKNSYVTLNIKANDYEFKILGESENEDFSCIK